MKRIIRIILVSITLTGVSCSEDIPDCPSQMCVIAGGWRLFDAYIDDVKDINDVSKYSLTLNTPILNTETSSDFQRVQTSGNEDSGVWSIQNNGTILRLIPDNNPVLTEDWIIESYSPRKLVLVINRDISFKQGPGTIRFVLEPI